MEYIWAIWEKSFSITNIDKPTEDHSSIYTYGEHKVYSWSNNIELASLNVFLIVRLISNKVGVAKLEKREDFERYKNRGNENVNQKQCIDDVISFPQYKKHEEYGPGFVNAPNADPFGEDQDFLKC